VVQWLPDDPYPQADIELLDEAPGAGDSRDDVEAQLRRVLALRAELGDPTAPATVELDPDTDVAAFQACALSGVGPVDAQRLLAAPGIDSRLALLAELLADETEVLELRLRG
jgi:Lon protease-like protein